MNLSISLGMNIFIAKL